MVRYFGLVSVLGLSVGFANEKQEIPCYSAVRTSSEFQLQRHPSIRNSHRLLTFLYNETIAKTEKQPTDASQVNLGNNPKSSQMPKSSSNSTTRILNHLALSIPSSSEGTVVICQAFNPEASSSTDAMTNRNWAKPKCFAFSFLTSASVTYFLARAKREAQTSLSIFVMYSIVCRIWSVTFVSLVFLNVTSKHSILNVLIAIL